MNIDWQHFTPYSAMIGGVLVGLAASLLMLLNGRVAGISGIVGGLLESSARGDKAWRWAFVLGLVVTPWVYVLFAVYPQVSVQANTIELVIAGLLVGLGTRYASGCTSGHGICGLGRLSPRSMVAVMAFVGAGFVTVYVLRHLING